MAAKRHIFGTDGVRGLANKAPLDPETSLSLGRALARVYLGQGGKNRIVIGKDTRLSGYMIENALSSGICSMGGEAIFSFEIKSKSKQAQNLMIDYVIHHVKANGKRTSKVFKLTNRELGAGGTVQISRRHAFRPISTRMYYAGKHRLEIQVNGVVLAGLEIGLR